MQVIITKRNTDGSYDADRSSPNVYVMHKANTKRALATAEIVYSGSPVRVEMYYSSMTLPPDKVVYSEGDGTWSDASK